jgi:hypothetical protein
VPSEVIKHRCSVCGGLFDHVDQAQECESAPIRGDKFQVGDQFACSGVLFRIVERRLRRVRTHGAVVHVTTYRLDQHHPNSLRWEGLPPLHTAESLQRSGYEKVI